MCPLTPVIRDVQGDDGMTAFKIRYLQNDATPNMVIRYAQRLQPGTVDAIRERVQARYGGPENAGKTLVLDQGADLDAGGQQPVARWTSARCRRSARSGSWRRARCRVSWSASSRCAAPGRGYQESMQKLANMWARPQWRSVCGALSQIVDVPGG